MPKHFILFVTYPHKTWLETRNQAWSIPLMDQQVYRLQKKVTLITFKLMLLTSEYLFNYGNVLTRIKLSENQVSWIIKTADEKWFCRHFPS